MGRVCKGPEEGPDLARVGAGVGDLGKGRDLWAQRGGETGTAVDTWVWGACAEACGEVPHRMDEGGVEGRTLEESAVSGAPTRWFWFKRWPQHQSVHSALTGWPSPGASVSHLSKKHLR